MEVDGLLYSDRTSWIKFQLFLAFGSRI